MSVGPTRNYFYSASIVFILHFIFRPFQLLQSGSIHKKKINKSLFWSASSFVWRLQWLFITGRKLGKNNESSVFCKDTNESKRKGLIDQASHHSLARWFQQMCARQKASLFSIPENRIRFRLKRDPYHLSLLIT